MKHKKQVNSKIWEVENNLNEKKLDVMKLTLKLNEKNFKNDRRKTWSKLYELYELNMRYKEFGLTSIFIRVY